jgi:hypothetical protein
MLDPGDKGQNKVKSISEGESDKDSYENGQRSPGRVGASRVTDRHVCSCVCTSMSINVCVQVCAL